jgi:hypothetical protein
VGWKLSGVQARWEVIQRLAPRYQQASVVSKGEGLDEVMQITGDAGRSAILYNSLTSSVGQSSDIVGELKYGAVVELAWRG